MSIQELYGVMFMAYKSDGKCGRFVRCYSFGASPILLHKDAFGMQAAVSFEISTISFDVE